ncbi:MAG TPA: hypothetical protein PLU72_00990 [Candidatus Ozemobacteraceae bacterium]|nr:hypothetical protein [Candidatus Ozemobacteraceae bacterium]HQG29897.1 hypothetical protein [Candidatus Ozemobacteraceae bacterium]
MDRISQNTTYQPPWMLRREVPPATVERPNDAQPARAQPAEPKPVPAQQNRGIPLPRLGQKIDVRA